MGTAQKPSLLPLRALWMWWDTISIKTQPTGWAIMGTVNQQSRKALGGEGCPTLWLIFLPWTELKSFAQFAGCLRLIFAQYSTVEKWNMPMISLFIVISLFYQCCFECWHPNTREQRGPKHWMFVSPTQATSVFLEIICCRDKNLNWRNKTMWAGKCTS